MTRKILFTNVVSEATDVPAEYAGVDPIVVDNEHYEISVKKATESGVGVVRPDNNTITVGDDGTITAVSTAYELPKATTEILGGVKPDGITCVTDADGVLSAVGGGGTQIQTDYAQEDNTKVDYIKNKIMPGDTMEFDQSLDKEWTLGGDLTEVTGFYKKIINNGNVLIALGQDSRCSRSTDDGMTWAQGGSLPATLSYFSNVAGGDGKFCALIANTSAYSEDDALTWVEGGTLPFTPSLNGSITHGNDRFVVVSANYTTYSTDTGRTWSQQIELPHTGENWRGCAYGDNRFVAIDSFKGTCYSEDGGVTWTLGGELPISVGIFYSFLYIDGFFVLMSKGRTAISDDGGLTWNEYGAYGLPDEDVHIATATDGSSIVGVLANNKYIISDTQGRGWNVYEGLPTDNLYVSIANSQSGFVAIPESNIRQVIILKKSSTIFNIKKATTEQLGGVKTDGTTCKTNDEGTLSVIAGDGTQLFDNFIEFDAWGGVGTDKTFNASTLLNNEAFSFIVGNKSAAILCTEPTRESIEYIETDANWRDIVKISNTHVVAVGGRSLSQGGNESPIICKNEFGTRTWGEPLIFANTRIINSISILNSEKLAVFSHNHIEIIKTSDLTLISELVGIENKLWNSSVQVRENMVLAVGNKCIGILHNENYQVEFIETEENWLHVATISGGQDAFILCGENCIGTYFVPTRKLTTYKVNGYFRSVAFTSINYKSLAVGEDCLAVIEHYIEDNSIKNIKTYKINYSLNSIMQVLSDNFLLLGERFIGKASSMIYEKVNNYDKLKIGSGITVVDSTLESTELSFSKESEKISREDMSFTSLAKYSENEVFCSGFNTGTFNLITNIYTEFPGMSYINYSFTVKDNIIFYAIGKLLYTVNMESKQSILILDTTTITDQDTVYGINFPEYSPGNDSVLLVARSKIHLLDLQLKTGNIQDVEDAIFFGAIWTKLGVLCFGWNTCGIVNFQDFNYEKIEMQGSYRRGAIINDGADVLCVGENGYGIFNLETKTWDHTSLGLRLTDLVVIDNETAFVVGEENGLQNDDGAYGILNYKTGQHNFKYKGYFNSIIKINSNEVLSCGGSHVDNAKYLQIDSLPRKISSANIGQGFKFENNAITLDIEYIKNQLGL